MFDGFSHDSIVKIKLPRQTSCKHEHRRFNLVAFQFSERSLLRSQGKTTHFRQSTIYFQMNGVNPAIVTEERMLLQHPT